MAKLHTKVGKVDERHLRSNVVDAPLQLSVNSFCITRSPTFPTFVCSFAI